MPLYQLFYDGEERPCCQTFRNGRAPTISPGAAPVRMLVPWAFSPLLGKIEEGDRRLLLYMAQKMANASQAFRIDSAHHGLPLQATIRSTRPAFAPGAIAPGTVSSGSLLHSIVLGGFELIS